MEKKYEMIPEGNLFRIKALRSFGDVIKGQLGGFIEKEDNLSHEGDCWIYDNAQVRHDAKVYENAKIKKNAYIFGDAKVYGNAEVSGSVSVFDYAEVYGNAIVYGIAQIYYEAHVYDYAQVYGYSRIGGTAHVCDKAHVYGNAYIYGNACIRSQEDYIVFKNWWSSGRYFTWTRSNDMWKVGCFYGTGEALVEKAYEDSKEKGEQYKLIVEYVERIKNVQICKQDSVATGEDGGDN